MGFYTILKSQGINPDAIRKFDYLVEGDNFIASVQLKAAHKPCPYCGSELTKIKEYKTKKIKGLNIGNKYTELYLRIPRYACKNCKKLLLMICQVLLPTASLKMNCL